MVLEKILESPLDCKIKSVSPKVNVRQKPLQCCKVISLQLIKLNEKRGKEKEIPGVPDKFDRGEIMKQGKG